MAGRDALAEPSPVDDLLDELLPDSLDWRHLVDKYPRAAFAAAAAIGFWLARSKSQLVLAAVGSYLAAEVGEAVSDLTEGGGH